MTHALEFMGEHQTDTLNAAAAEVGQDDADTRTGSLTSFAQKFGYPFSVARGVELSLIVRVCALAQPPP